MDDGQDVALMAPISPLTAISEPIRRRKAPVTGEVAGARRAPSGRLRQVAIGGQLARWDAMKSRLALDSHAQLAEVLLDGMEAVVGGDVVWGPQCSNPTLKTKLASFFKRRSIPALVVPRPTRAAARKPRPAGPKKSPAKLKIALRKGAPKSQKAARDHNGRQKAAVTAAAAAMTANAAKRELSSSEEEEGEAGVGGGAGSEVDDDYSPQEPSRHGLKKAWLGRHLKGKKSKTRHRHREGKKAAAPKTCPEEEGQEEEEGVEATAAAVAAEVKPLRKLRCSAVRKKLVKKLKQLKVKQDKAKAATKTVEELFGADAVLIKVYCCRKCTSQLESLEALRTHWQTHAAEDEGGSRERAPPSATEKGDEEEEEEEGKDLRRGEEEEGDQEVPADVQRMARVMTRCPLCQKLFSNILAHTACHSNYLCEECGMLFRQRRSLKLHHRAVHEVGDTGQLPFVCGRCGRAFRWEASLRKHRTLHSQHRQFVCQTCGKSFKVQAHLKRHEIMHEAVKPFVCPHCGRRFTELSNMKVHTRIHTGEKPYVCDVCQRAYAHKVSLKTHKKKEHGIDMWLQGYITQPVIEFDDEGRETEYSIARRSRRPSFSAPSKPRKRKLQPEREPSPPLPETAATEDGGAQQVGEMTLEKHRSEMSERAERDDSEASQASSHTSQTSITAHAQPPPLPPQQQQQHFTESKLQTPLLHPQYQQQQQQHQPPPLQHQQHPPLHQPIQPPQEVSHTAPPPQHLPAQHLQMHSQSYAHGGHLGKSAQQQQQQQQQQQLEEAMDSEPCSPEEEEEENPGLLPADLITNQLRHAQRLQIPDGGSNHHHLPPPPPQPLPLQLAHSQSLQQQQQQQQQHHHHHHQPLPPLSSLQQPELPSHSQPQQPLPHVQLSGMRPLQPLQSHQAGHQRPALPGFEAAAAAAAAAASPDRQYHRQGVVNAVPGLDLNALVAGSMPYMYWGSQQYQGAPPYLQRNVEENSLESPKQ